MFAYIILGGAMTAVGTIRLYRPAPDTASEPERCGRATFAVCHTSAARIQIGARGDIDAVNGRAFGRYVERHTDASRQLLVDLRSVDFFGSQGFTALYYISVHCARSDVDWIFIGSPAVRRVLRICDPDGELPAVVHIDAALERLDRLAISRHRN
jgi:anti-anti-sigma factor